MKEGWYIGMYEFASPEYDEAVALRTEVLRKPLNMEFLPDQLAKEYADFHFGLWDNEGLNATLTLTDLGEGDVKMRQVAVSPQKQGQGIGGQLVQFCEKWAANKGYTKMVLHARETAVKFYLNLGYDIVGDRFEEVGIPHFKMEKRL
ncbi:MAG: GNAT family N-acetyltransferase [Saprospiraceae bacterium]|nr:GNAT family N-acetyltransferase [Saprospiraceae bacterium]